MPGRNPERGRSRRQGSGFQLTTLPGPYDFIYSFYCIGYHWALEHFLDEIDSLMHEQTVCAFDRRPGSRAYEDCQRSTPERLVFTNYRASPGEIYPTPERSKFVHFSTLHLQPWRPFPKRFAAPPSRARKPVLREARARWSRLFVVSRAQHYRAPSIGGDAAE